MTEATRTGTIVAVCTSETGGIPKYPQPQITIGELGVQGDFHNGPTRISHRDKRVVPNDRQVSLVAIEVLEDIEEQLGVAIPPGGFGENVLVQGLGDLGDLPLDAEIRFESGVALRVTEHNTPCSHLSVYHRLVPKLAIGRRGILTVVLQTGVLRPGDRVEIVANAAVAPATD